MEHDVLEEPLPRICCEASVHSAADAGAGGFAHAGHDVLAQLAQRDGGSQDLLLQDRRERLRLGLREGERGSDEQQRGAAGARFSYARDSRTIGLGYRLQVLWLEDGAMRPSPVVLGALLALRDRARGVRTRPASARQPSPWRVLVGGSFSSSSFQTTYVSRYSPPFEFVSHTSEATETLPLDASGAFGLQLGVERTLGAHVALQLLGGYSGAELSGEPGRYELRTTYASRPPPSNEPVDVTIRRSEAEPAATRPPARPSPSR